MNCRPAATASASWPNSPPGAPARPARPASGSAPPSTANASAACSPPSPPSPPTRRSPPGPPSAPGPNSPGPCAASTAAPPNASPPPAAPRGPALERALHDARKAAKRARYAGESAGRPARAFTRRMKALQDVLGRHQDAVVARDTLRALSDGGFGYGVLYGRQSAELGFARELLPQVWEQAARRPRKLR
nr:CHAD domain-containing protein [Kitasatospora fiedleri]